MIGAGIFTTTGFLMGFLGNPLFMILLWVIGGIIAFCGAIAFGELGASFPEAGGEYFFITKLFHPLPGFLSGWLSLIVGFSAPIAASAIGFAKYFLWAFPGLPFIGSFTNPEIFTKILAILIILIFTLIHSRGIVFGSKIQNGLSILKVMLVVGLIVAGFTVGKGSFRHFADGQSFHFDFQGWKSAGLSLMFISFAYSGWNSATYIGSEIKNPRRVIPWSLFISTAVVLILYVLLNLYFVYSIPPAEMVGEPEIGAMAAEESFGKKAGTVISLLISFALFSSLSAFIILGPRVYFAMAREGYFFKFAARIHPRFKVPVYAIILQSFIAIVLVISGTFEQILVYMGFSLGIFPILAVLGVFKLRTTGKSVLKFPGYPYVHIIFIVASIFMLTLAFFERPVESSVAILTALSGIPVYYWFERKKKTKL
jgi:APA family basic amino acid/polyamine antiporter